MISSSRLSRPIQAAPTFGSATRRAPTPCKAVTGTLDLAHQLTQEIIQEGVLHVSAAQSGSCDLRFGDIDLLRAPALPSLEEVLAAEAADASSAGPDAGSSGQPRDRMSINRAGSADRVMREALCLATPEDNPAERTNPVRPLQQLAPRNSSAGRLIGRPQQPRGSSSMLTQEAELLQLEGAAATYSQYGSTAFYASEALQASAAIRRQRRRGLLRMLREGRSLTATGLTLLAGISASIGSIGSCDDADTPCAVFDEEGSADGADSGGD